MNGTQNRDEQDDLIGQAVSEYFEAVERGECIQLHHFTERFPEIQDVLRSVIPALQIADGFSEEAEEEVDRTERQLGDFRILRQIGRGGMGIVYEAEQISMKRRVALKVLPLAGLVDEMKVQRFRNEVRAVAALNHPHIVPVYTVGEERGIQYYAMQLIRGRSLEKVISSLGELRDRRHVEASSLSRLSAIGRSDHHTSDYEQTFDSAASDHDHQRSSDHDKVTTVARASDSTIPGATRQEYLRSVAVLGIQAANALEHAHQQGIIHRDIKPAKFILDAISKLYVTDFGLARIEADAGLTMTGDVVGTLRYMSPEQATGNRIVDHRADIYSLGATLYELAALKPAFSESDRRQLLKQVAFEEPTPLRRMDPDIPSELETIVHTAMSKEVDLRYQTAQQLADDLQRFLDHRPIVAKPPTISQIVTKWVRRNPAIAWACCLCMALVLIGALLFSLRERANAKKIEELATSLQRQLAEQHLERGQADCDKGYVARGLHWFARGLQIAPTDDQALRSVFRDNLGIWQRFSASPTAIFFNENPIYNLEYSPDGSKLVTVDTGGGVRLWSSESGNLLHDLEGHTSGVFAAKFSADGKLLLTGSGDRTARVWSVHTGETLAVLKHDDDRLGWFGFHTDDAQVVTNFESGIQTWSIETGELVRSLKCGHPIALGPGGRFALARKDGQLSIWSVETGQKVGNPLQHESRLNEITFSPDGTRVLTGTATGKVRMWSTETGGLCWTAEHHDTVLRMSFDSTESLVLTAAADGVARLWSAETGAPKSKPIWHSSFIKQIAFGPDGGHFVTVDQDAFIRVWSTATGELLKQPTRFRLDSSLRRIAFHPDGTRLALAPLNNEAFQIDISDLQSRTPSRQFDCNACSLGLSPDGKRILTGGWATDIRLWSTETGELLGTPLKYNTVVWSLAFSPVPPYSYALASCSDGTVRVLDIQSDELKESKILRLHGRKTVRKVAFAPDGKTFATGGWDGTVRIMSTTTWQEIVPTLVHPNHIEDVTFSPDGDLVATACQDGNVRIWSSKTGKPVGAPLEHSDDVLVVTFSPDGKKILTGGRNRRVRIWDLETWKPSERNLEHMAEVESVGYNPDGTRVVSGTNAGEVHIWSTATWQRIGPPVGIRESNGSTAIFTRDGRSILIGGFAGAALWKIEESQESNSPDSEKWVQAITGREMTPSGSLKWLDRETWRKRRRTIDEQR